MEAFHIHHITNSKEAPKGFHSWMEMEGLKITVHLKQHTHTQTTAQYIVAIMVLGSQGDL